MAAVPDSINIGGNTTILSNPIDNKDIEEKSESDLVWETELSTAIINGDVNKLSQLKNKGYTINLMHSKLGNLLAVTVGGQQHEQYERVVFILEKGGNPNLNASQMISALLTHLHSVDATQIRKIEDIFDAITSYGFESFDPCTLIEQSQNRNAEADRVIAEVEIDTERLAELEAAFRENHTDETETDVNVTRESRRIETERKASKEKIEYELSFQNFISTLNAQIRPTRDSFNNDFNAVRTRFDNALDQGIGANILIKDLRSVILDYLKLNIHRKTLDWRAEEPRRSLSFSYENWRKPASSSAAAAVVAGTTNATVVTTKSVPNASK